MVVEDAEVGRQGLGVCSIKMFRAVGSVRLFRGGVSIRQGGEFLVMRRTVDGQYGRGYVDGMFACSITSSQY